ncbi:hypothetical protein DPMN_070521 [Dreissena polymorpha]|uniref:Uncharacterized protein n=1 Tax=Dreissena polymorpha TaxID=45954 RepID=A0A9D3Z347_DREPO|nr:hypothetical protein DPMN_070521 [Dreissena polymorpha]
MGGFGWLYGEEEAKFVPKVVSENQDLVREKSVKSQGILFHQVGGNPDIGVNLFVGRSVCRWVHIKCPLSNSSCFHASFTKLGQMLYLDDV